MKINADKTLIKILLIALTIFAIVLSTSFFNIPSSTKSVDGNKWYTKSPARTELCKGKHPLAFFNCWFMYLRTPQPAQPKPTLTSTSVPTLTPTNLPYPVETITPPPYLPPLTPTVPDQH